MFNISNMLNVGGKIELKFEINYRVEMLELILNMVRYIKRKEICLLLFAYTLLCRNFELRKINFKFQK